jgi:hypothetical protein
MWIEQEIAEATEGETTKYTEHTKGSVTSVISCSKRTMDCGGTTPL